MTEFERTVLADLAELKSQMRWLVGNGQPGWIQELSERVDHHEAALQRARGMGGALACLLTLVHVAIDYLKWRR